MSTVFETLNAINVNEHTEKKNGLTYLSWAWAWAEIKKKYPQTKYGVYENENGWNYHTDGKTGWVKVYVQVDEDTIIEYLPIMDFKNKSIPLDQITSMNVNTAIQRALTKAIARHGLGLYIYAGEDLPDIGENEIKEYKTWSKASEQEKIDYKRDFMRLCADYGLNKEDITDFFNFVNPSINESESEKHNSIVKFLKGDYLEDQINAYLGWKINEDK